MPWLPYRYDTKIESDGTELTLNGHKVPEGFVLEVTQIAIVDITTGATHLSVGYLDVMNAYHVFCMNAGTSLSMHQIYGEQYVFAGEAPAGRITTPTDGDDCYFSVHGKLWPADQVLPCESAAMGTQEQEP